MYIERINRYKLHISPFEALDPVIVETSREMIVTAYVIAEAYTLNGRVRKVEAIKAIRRIAKATDGEMWGLKATKLFVENVMEDKYLGFKSAINQIFYEKPEK